MSFDDSVIELGQGGLPSDQQLLSSISLPTSVPQDEPVLTEDNNSIQIPNQIPSGEQILTDPVELTGITAAPTSTKGDKYYIHTQIVASDIWTISHNLQKHPAIHIEDLNGEEIIAEIVYITNNIARVYFGEPYVGTAHCN